MAINLSTCNGDFKLSLTFDNDGKSFYDVYSDNNYEKFVGEYRPIYNFDDVEEREWFIEHFEKWLDENDIVNLDTTFNPDNKDDNIWKLLKQNMIKNELESIVFKRFSKESLEKKLTEIFNEPIKIELICEDVDYLTDWNYAFSSKQDVIGGDFDIYVLMHKNNKAHEFDNSTFLVTEVNWEFFNRY